jgi:hypothetical protein
MTGWKGRGPRGRYTPEEQARNEENAARFDMAIVRYRVRVWLDGAEDRASCPTLAELRAAGYDVVEPHAWIVTTSDGVSVAECFCGWSGTPVRDESAAQAEAVEHVEMSTRTG